METVAHILDVEVHVHQPAFGIHHVAVLLAVLFEDEALFAVFHAISADEFEEFLHLIGVQQFGIRTVEGSVHLHAGHPGFRSRVFHVVPLPAATDILFFHFFQCG